MQLFLESIKSSLTEENKEEIKKISEQCFPNFKVEIIDEKTSYTTEKHTNINTFVYFISKENPWKEYKIHWFQLMNTINDALKKGV
jgi:hypothetical protein